MVGRKINLTAVIVTIIIIIPITLFGYFYFDNQNKQLLEKESTRKRNQEAYDKCISMAEYKYVTDYRSDCWVYNHDATGCDLGYLESLLKVDTPQTGLEQAVADCEDQYPVADRLHTTVSSEFESLLESPTGNLTEREAVRKVLALDEFIKFSSPPIEEGYKLRYDIERPTKENPKWQVYVYKSGGTDRNIIREDITLNYYLVDAFTGEVGIKK